MFFPPTDPTMEGEEIKKNVRKNFSSSFLLTDIQFGNCPKFCTEPQPYGRFTGMSEIFVPRPCIFIYLSGQNYDVIVRSKNEDNLQNGMVGDARYLRSF